MALTFNGTSSGLARAGSIVSAYPFTMFAWTRATTTQSAFAVEVASDPSSSGVHQGHGALSSGSRFLAWSSVGSGVSAYSTLYLSTGVWVPCMVVFASASLRKVYYGSGAVAIETTNVPQNPAQINALSVGKQAVRSANYWAGDLACVGLWSVELSAAEFTTLAGGAVPSTVRSASLIDYWSLLTQGSIQTGINGRMLAATNTTQAATHPIVESTDTTPPNLSGSITVTNLASSGYTLSWPAATDNVGISTYERSLDAGGTWVEVGNVLSVNITGRAPNTTDQVRIRAKDAGGNLSGELATAVTLPPDTLAPTMNGAITVSALTSTSYTLAWPAASDNVAVTAYAVSLDAGATYVSVGNVLGASITGRTAGTTDQVRVRALDAAANPSAPLSVAVTLTQPADATPPTMTGVITVSALTSTGYTLGWSAATDNVAVTSYEVSLDGGTTYTSVGNVLSASITGRVAGTTDQVRVRAKDAAGNPSAPLSTAVTLPSASDTTLPVLTGSITVSSLTSTSYTLAWPVGSDNVAVTAYERSLDGGSSWLSVGNVLTVSVSGRTPSTTDQVRVRARDAAGNVSTPPLSAAVTLPSGGTGATLVTPPMKNNTGTLLANLTGITVNVYNVSSGALVVQKTSLTSNAAGIVSVTDPSLAAGTTYAYEVVTAAVGRRLPTGVAA